MLLWLASNPILAAITRSGTVHHPRSVLMHLSVVLQPALSLIFRHLAIPRMIHRPVVHSRPIMWPPYP